MKEQKIKHLDMIEAIIERMAKNSFQLKGWGMTLVAAVGALAAQGSDQRYILLSFIPIIGFWFLDAYYLYQERRYKKFYEEVAKRAEKDIDFSLKPATVSALDNLKSYLCALISFSELLFYAPVTISLIILFKVLKVFC